MKANKLQREKNEFINIHIKYNTYKKFPVSKNASSPKSKIFRILSPQSNFATEIFTNFLPVRKIRKTSSTKIVTLQEKTVMPRKRCLLAREKAVLN